MQKNRALKTGSIEEKKPIWGT